MKPLAGEIANRVLEYFDATRRDLPWRTNRQAYPIWISEIMLQQTRIETVIPFFTRWMEKFPTIERLAASPTDDVLAAWSGLGYYSRARNIHRCAQEVAEAGGSLPRSAAELIKLPGIGRYTAGAIASQAYDQREAVVDGNVARVLARLFVVELDIKSAAGQKELWRLAEELVPSKSPGDYNQGLMELGQRVCKPRTPDCKRCPVADLCGAFASDRTAELPNLPKRKKSSDKVVIERFAALILSGKNVLLAKRPAAGLYAGLWEIPAADSREGLEAALPSADIQKSIAMTREQELSHRRLKIAVYLGELARKPRIVAGYTSVKWQPVASVADLGVSSATAAIIEALT